MKIQFFFGLAAVTGMFALGCSSSDTGGGTSGGGDTSSTTTADTTSTTTDATSTTTDATSTSSGGDDCSMKADTASCRSCCADQNPEGVQMLQSLAANSCGCEAGAVCEAECSAEAYCSEVNGLPTEGSACADCINGLGTTEGCALAILGDCQADPDCSAALSCILSCP